MRKIREHLTVLLFLVGCSVISVGCENHEMTLVIEKPTEVRSIDQTPSSSDAQSANVQPGKVITILKPGETAKAVGVYHGQDHDGFKVKLADGTEGIIMAGDTFKVGSQ